ncbi:MAG: hypothetical protein EBR82_45430 [Caulobacteraceae bacterium]|nr:hypothetical protein [Caulobacteraceae bacterium]
MSNFEQIERIIAVPASAVSTMFPDLLAQYGEELSYGSGTTRTIGAFWNDAAKTSIYAASIERGNIAPQPLTDGRLAFRCLWQADLAAAFDAGEIDGVEQLTEAQLSTLIPQPSTAL